MTEKELTLQKAIEIATATEIVVLQGTQLTAEQDSEEVHRLNHEWQCQCCGKSEHPTTACQFCQSTCYNCGECGHMQVMCKRGKKLTSGKPQINQISLKDDNEDDPTIRTITGGHTQGYHGHLKLNQKPVKMELDTGATISVMSEQQWKTLFTESKPLSQYEGKPLQGYSGYEVQVMDKLQ